MGCNVPLGCEPDGRTLKISQKEAEAIKTIYDLYRRHRALDAVIKHADQKGLQSIAKHGKALSFKSSQIHYVLTNPVYAGKICHKDKTHEGRHEAIIDPDRWQVMETQLKEGAARQRGTKSTKTISLLSGKLLTGSA
jgi:hypothetical protein